MPIIEEPVIKLKGSINHQETQDIKHLAALCYEFDRTVFKLELDSKSAYAASKSNLLSDINEYLYYSGDQLIGYIGICGMGGDELEINGMTHPQYRRRGIFTRLFSFVCEECKNRRNTTALLLSDSRSAAGLRFIEKAGVVFDHSEYEMFLSDKACPVLPLRSVTVRKATGVDAGEVARQDAIMSGMPTAQGNPSLLEDLESGGLAVYIAEVEGQPVGKVHLELIDGVGGIYGLGVLPRYRGKGFGRGILQGAVDELKIANAAQIKLQVYVDNETALRLYESSGFEIASQMDYFRYLGLPKQNTAIVPGPECDPTTGPTV